MDHIQTPKQEYNDLAFLEENTKSYNFKDILFLILRNLHWLLFFSLLGAFLALFYVRRQQPVFLREAAIILQSKDSPSYTQSGRESSIINAYTSTQVVSTINNEMMIMRSRTLMEEVVNRLDLTTTYYSKTRLVGRVKDLYRISPIKVTFLDVEENEYKSVVVTFLSKQTFLLSGFGSDETQSITGNIHKIISTPVGNIIVEPTNLLTEEWMGSPITIAHLSKEDVSNMYRSRLGIERNDTKNSVVNLRLTDQSGERATDILNTLIEVYNDDAINEIGRASCRERV